MKQPRSLLVSAAGIVFLAASHGFLGCSGSDGDTSRSMSGAGPAAGAATTSGGAGSSMAGAPSTGAGRSSLGGTGGVGQGGAAAGQDGRGAANPGGSAGATSSGGTAGATGGGSSAGGSAAATCNSMPVTLNQNPFGCKFAWGASPDGSLASYGYLQFATYWIEGGIKADGTFGTCSGCTWIQNNFTSGASIPVYYAYIIGFMGHAAGLQAGTTCPAGQPDCPNLTNQGATLVRNNRDKIVQAYASYAQQTHTVWPSKPLLWLLEGDMVQYTASSQAGPLTMAELTQLTTDITCAIKSNMPNAVVAINHSSWNSDQVTNDYWHAMKSVPYDMVWTTGVANNGGFIASGTNASSYNGATATYAYIHQLTGKTIWVDDSCGVSAMADSWSSSSAATLNMQISSGVIAFAHCGAPSGSYQSATSALASQLMSTCP